MNVTVIGTGYVGLVAACCLANSGHQVIAVEKNENILNILRSGNIPIYEEGLSEIFQSSIESGLLTCSNDLEGSISEASVVIVAVGTPSLPDGRVDLIQVNNVISSICRYANKPLTVVMKSTVPPGTGKYLMNRYCSKAKAAISYVSNPEFLREGKAVYDWYNPDRIVIGGSDAEGTERVMSLYADITAPKLCLEVTDAEMVKYASNAFLATKISFINEIANLCERVGADVTSVSSAVGMDQRIGGSFLQAGLGYGGSCFPKDTKGLDYISVFNGYNFTLLKGVIEVNANQRILAVRKIIGLLDGVVDKNIAVLGLAFKPGTDDIREAPAIDIITHLINEGAKVNAYDPNHKARENSQKVCPSDVAFFEDPYQACQGCVAVLLVTEWKEIVNLDWVKINKDMKAPYLLFDGRNILDKVEMKKHGYLYSGIGR